MGFAALAPRLLRPAAPLIARMTARYISDHRTRLLPDAEPIKTAFKAALRQFFSEAVLEDTRVVRAQMPEPRFYPVVKFLGTTGLLEISSIGAITLIDVVAYPRQLDRSTLAHELVHAVQYRVLGLRLFADRYVKGFFEGGGYDGIPLERQAYELEARIRRNPKQAFSVEEDVVRRLEAGLL